MGSLGSDILDKPACRHADDEEKRMKNEYKVPRDPLLDAHNANNLPLIAFSYLVRRFIMCPRWCMICSRLVCATEILPDPTHAAITSSSGLTSVRMSSAPSSISVSA